MKEYPLTHDYSYSFELSAEDSTADSGAMPLYCCDDGLVNPEDVQVNPANDNYESASSWQCFPGSVVQKVNMKLGVCIPTAASVYSHNTFSADMQGIKIPALVYYILPICMNLDDITEENHRDGTTVGSVLGLQKEASTENQIHPIFENANELISDVDYPVPQGGAFGDIGLDTDMTPENVTFNMLGFEQEMRQDALGGLLKAITQGGIRRNTIFADRPQYTNRWIDTPGRTKRVQRGQYCGFNLAVPQAGQADQFWTIGELSAISHLRISARVYFNEYNDAFDQS